MNKLDQLRFELQEAERRQQGEGELLPAERAAALSLILLQHGCAIVRTGDEAIRLNPSEAYICVHTPGQAIAFGSDSASDKPPAVYLFHFDMFARHESGWRRLDPASEDTAWLAGRYSPDNDPSAARLAAETEAYWRSADPLERMAAQSAFLMLLCRLLQSRREEGERPEDAIARTKAYIDSRCQEPLKVGQLARMSGFNPHYYLHLFKKQYGTSPIEYMTGKRMERAKALLLEPGESIREVARAAGYKDEFYFSRLFKRKTGMAPSVYIRSRRHKIVSYSYAVTGQLLALQIIPYGAPRDWQRSAHYMSRYGRDIPLHLQAADTPRYWEENRNALRNSRPEAIVAVNWPDVADREEMDGIAPALYVPWREASWREHLQLTGEFLNRSKEAGQWLRQYEELTERAGVRIRRRLGEETVMMLYFNGPKAYICGRHRTGSVLYDDLHIKPPEPVRQIFAYQAAEPGDLLLYDPDHMICIVNRATTAPADMASWSEAAAWRALKAVRSGCVYQVGMDPWLEYSASGHQRIVEEALKLFAQDRP
ncbi:AraC family transcriptional regulator [Paenibacillus doosanensis]|uniref:helix-turn-helix domain-containing protein n=1 Tax=Paenibacillus doosanensis TaxID=1229154 RepID=UPI00217F391A|nr:helix-turn-helix domain-containing protein [Paenibacillus doosanensis]MCS7464116.1 AraC family transcriptional regulator [Paenibacillus doosanensis]